MKYLQDRIHRKLLLSEVLHIKVTNKFFTQMRGQIDSSLEDELEFQIWSSLRGQLHGQLFWSIKKLLYEIFTR